jgi:magnesium chelatase family protein
VRETVQRVRDVQRTRYGGAFACNAHLDAAATREYCTLAPGAETLLQRAIDQLGFSARAYDKVLRVARTLADLDNSEAIRDNHVAEAIQYRNLDRQVL